MNNGNTKLLLTIDLLRKLYLDGVAIQGDYFENVSGTDSRARAWVARARVLFTHLFYNSKFLEDFEKYINEAYSSYNDSINYHIAVDLLLGYICGIGQSFKNGFIKDQYAGIDNSYSRNVFVAMSFEKTLADNYDVGIKPALEELGYNPIRVDRIAHNDKIDSKICQLIAESRFVVADFTGHRTGVYYEAGFAKGLGLPVVQVCNSLDFEKLHFDIQSINTLKFDTSSMLKSMLKEHVNETIGRYKEQTLTSLNIEDDMPF